MAAPNPVANGTPRNYAAVYNNIGPGAFDFYCDPGVYSLMASASVWGTVQLQRMINDPTLGAIYVNVGAAVAANGFAEYHLPAGQYHLAVGGTTGLTAVFERIGPWAGR
jgi:hypothetical protein